MWKGRNSVFYFSLKISKVNHLIQDGRYMVLYTYLKISIILEQECSRSLNRLVKKKKSLTFELVQITKN